ncbi:MAG: hypothetical protein KA988_06595 [Longilinea sp.]|nr:hypothetical protein [Longilinea sp.]MCA1955124.1 hypothetical protein [Anaerolinea sp.]
MSPRPSWFPAWLKAIWGEAAHAQPPQPPQRHRFAAITPTWSANARPAYDRPDRLTTLRQTLEAWRTNPLARRIVELTSQYAVGGGMALHSPDPAAHAFLQAWWQHPLNALGSRLPEWCDECTRTGDLFLLLSTDASGLTWVRALPSADIEAIETAPGDVEQELSYRTRPLLTNDGRWLEGQHYPAESSLVNLCAPERTQPAILHLAINRPCGAVFGESDLAPLLKWLARYAAWLEDRARLNRYRTAFVYVVKAQFANEAERLARQEALAANPPSPGSILVCDESESWSVLTPHLEAHESAEDGLALKRMIAVGAGLPLHFLAEPESSTRTTAEAAGGPTYRRFAMRQRAFLGLLEALARAALQRAAAIHPLGSPDPAAEVHARGADLSTHDNLALAQAAAAISTALLPLQQQGLLDKDELLRLLYRFTGETPPGNTQEADL